MLNVTLRPVPEGGVDTRALFALYESSLREHIDRTFGWDEAFQRDRFDKSYCDAEFSLIDSGLATVGYCVVKRETESLHLSLLLVQPEFQNRGIGRVVMQTLMSQAAEHNRPLTLSCFLRNEGAMRFYEQLGFSIVSRDEHFVTYRLPAFG
jgi:ribosomal protein S18 acetylase RimI-like enzyme